MKLSDEARKIRNEYYRQYRSQLSPEAKKKKNEYQKQYRLRNRDKTKQYNADYWERKAGNIPLVKQVKQLSKQGMTQREISIELSISLGAVNKYLNQ